MTSTSTSTPIKYTQRSLREVVIAIAHLLDHFATDDHPGLQEPHNRDRIIPDTHVIVRGNLNNDENLVGFQLFVTNADNNDVMAVVFDMVAYERHGDTYLFNMLKKVGDTVREQHRPSDQRLRELSTQFMLKH